MSDSSFLQPLVCPECGGILGAAPGDPRAVCRCFAAVEPPLTDAGLRAETAAGTGVEVGAGPVTAGTSVGKFCRVCGENVSGHRRLKDSAGYMCLRCAKVDKASSPADDPNLVSCGECGRRLKPGGLVDYNGVMICKICHRDHVEQSRTKLPPPDLTKHKSFEWQSLRSLLIIAAVLLLIFLFARYGILRRV